jgi:hypothetical protein
MNAKIVPFPLKERGPFRFTYTVIFDNGRRISGKSDHEVSAMLVELLLEKYPDAIRVSVIKEI